MAECIKEYKKLKVSEAEEFAHDGDYKYPIQLLKNVVSLIGDDSEINSLTASQGGDIAVVNSKLDLK